MNKDINLEIDELKKRIPKVDEDDNVVQLNRKRDLDDVADQIQNFDHSGTNNEKENDSTVKQESFFTSANRGIGSFFG